MHIGPSWNRHQNIIAILATVKNIYIIKIKINNMNLGMVLPQIVPKLIHITAPPPVHEEKIFPIQIFYL